MSPKADTSSTVQRAGKSRETVRLGERSTLTLLARGSFLVRLDALVTVPFIPVMATDLGFLARAGGMLVTAYAAVYTLAAPVFGALTDEWGRKRPASALEVPLLCQIRPFFNVRCSRRAARTGFTCPLPGSMAFISWFSSAWCTGRSVRPIGDARTGDARRHRKKVPGLVDGEGFSWRRVEDVAWPRHGRAIESE